MTLSVKFNGYELSDYLDVISGFDRGIGSSTSTELKKMGDTGKKLVSLTKDEKTIPMPFILKYDLIEKRRTLAGILNVDEAKELIFGDEPNKIYYAVPTGDISVAESNFLGRGTITWVIPDGVAHNSSLNSAVAKVDSNGILAMDIDYKGTEKTPLTLTIHNNAETGFIGAIGMHEDKNTFLTQLGYVDEADGETREKVQIVIGKDGGVFTKWTDATTFYENAEKAVVAKMPITTSYGGWLGGVPTDAKKDNTKSWYGTAKELVLTDAMDYAYLWGRAWFETGKMGQTGQWTLAFIDENNVFIAGIALSKSDKVGNNAVVYFLGNDGNGSKIYQSIPFTPSFWLPPNPYGSQARINDRNMFDLRKEGSKITYFFNGKYYPFTIPFASGKKVKRIQFYTGQYADRTVQQSVSYMGLRDVLVADLKSQCWQDLPNRFPAGSNVIITKENGMNMIYRDGIKTLEDFVTGSNFPYLLPGQNHIEFPYSDFTASPPTVTATYETRWV
ncbi:distal tail protein Dit [Enterococcus casseliflavus]|uniref:distal tail protein Dit n=1 Tax=Enterococcus casseliflavus TaxID=37734 RepID=UPI000E48E761|nr:distal tail protein Dit [Enterococcus casseliflavus]RHH55532.1 hypothetical protein DW201_09320 [Enterococcus casseliflavus]